MQEVELTSELMVMQLDGLQDKKASIERFYRKFDEVFKERERIEHQFRSVIDGITVALEDSLTRTAFRRPPRSSTVSSRSFSTECTASQAPRFPRPSNHSRQRKRPSSVNLSRCSAMFSTEFERVTPWPRSTTASF